LSGQALLQAPPGQSTAQMRQRIQPAFERALARQNKPNSALQGAEIDQHCVLDLAAMQLLNTAAKQLAWSGRSTHRVLKVARTVADLDNSESISPKHMAEAIQYRRGLQTMP
jgi:magnesium chelatase family protein